MRMADEEEKCSQGRLNFYQKQLQSAQDTHDRGLDFCYAWPKNVDRALQEFETVIRMRESLLGKYHNDTSLSYFRKASVLRDDKKDYAAALVVARRELRITQKLLGGDADIPIVHSNGQKKLLSERIQWIQEVLLKHRKGISEEEVIKYSSQLLQAMEFERLGDQCMAAQQWQIAITQYNCALTLESSAYARNLLEMADLEVKIGDCYAAGKDFEAALEEYQNAQIKYQEEFGPAPHATVASVLGKCASIHLTRNEFDLALGMYAKVYSIYEPELGLNHRLSVEALQDLKLVTVKEMEELRKQERLKKKQSKSERRQTKTQEGRDIEMEERSLF